MRGTLKVSPRLLPIDFLENLGRSRSLTFCRKNVKKILREGIEGGLEPTKFRRCISNRFRFFRYSTISSKKNWGQPRSPAPDPKNLEKSLEVDVNDVLKSAEFRRPGLNRFRNKRL